MYYLKNTSAQITLIKHVLRQRHPTSFCDALLSDSLSSVVYSDDARSEVIRLVSLGLKKSHVVVFLDRFEDARKTAYTTADALEFFRALEDVLSLNVQDLPEGLQHKLVAIFSLPQGERTLSFITQRLKANINNIQE
jgi:hypothetical protein